jgi:hypothetical protein
MKILLIAGGAFSISWWIEGDWRVGGQSLVWGRNLGVLLFALGCAYAGIIDYIDAAWPALVILVASLAILQRAKDKPGALAAAAANVLGPTAVGMTIVLAILLVLSVATLDSPIAGFFEAQFTLCYSSVRPWLEPPLRAVLAALALLFVLQCLYPEIGWLKRFRQAKTLAASVAWVLWLVCLMLFVGGEGVYRHGMRPVAKLSWQYDEQLKRLATAEAKQAIFKNLAQQLRESSERESSKSDLNSLAVFAGKIATAAYNEAGPPELRRGFSRSGISEEDFVKAVARRVSAQNVREYGNAPRLRSSGQVPPELQQPATNVKEALAQGEVLRQATAKANAAEAAADSVWAQGVSAVLEALPDFAGPAKIATSFLRELAGDYIQNGVTLAASKVELWFPNYWKDAFDPQTGGSPLVTKATKDLAERDSLPGLIIQRVQDEVDHVKAEIER